jgi:hypothetical protein
MIKIPSITIAVACGLLIAPAYASIETDKNVGICINYLILTNKTNAAEIALQQADNQDRAMQFARAELKEVKRLSSSGQ